MTGKNNHPATEYEQFIANNEEMINHFSHAPVNEQPLVLLEPAEGLLGGKLKDHTHSRVVKYTKHVLATYPARSDAASSHESTILDDEIDRELSVSRSSVNQPPENKSNAGPIPTLSIVNQDGRYHNLVLETTPDKAEEIWQACGFDPHLLVDPITRMVAKLGHYKATIFNRHVERRGLVSAKDLEKSQIVSFAQDCIAGLHPLYERVNTYSESVSPRTQLQIIDDELGIYHRKLTEVFRRLNENQHNGSKTLKKCITNAELAVVSYRQKIQSLIAKGEALNASDVAPILKPYASLGSQPKCLVHFIQEQANAVLTAAFSANYDISWLFRGGSLAGDIIAAKVIAEEMTTERVDYHNPVTAEHAFNFKAKARASANGMVTINFKKYGFHPGNEIELARQIALIDAIQKGEPLAGKEKEGFFGINWSVNIYEFFTVPLAVVASFIVDILGFVSDILYVIGGALHKKWAKPAVIDPMKKEEKTRYPSEWMAEKLGVHALGSVYKNHAVTSKLFGSQAVTQMPRHSLVGQMILFVGRQIDKLTLEPFIELLKELVRSAKTTKMVPYDFKIGTRIISSEEITTVLDQCLKRQNDKEKTNIESCDGHIHDYLLINSNSLIETYSDWERNLRAQANSPVVEALAPYSLTPDEPNDVLSGASDVIKMIFDVPTQKIYRERPIGGVGFSYMASMAALPMLFASFPKFGFVEYWTTNVTYPVAKLFVGHTEGIGATITTSLIEAKGLLLLMDTANGREGMLVNAAKALLEEPVMIGLVCGASIGIGNLIAFGISIPGISAWLADHAGGDFPYREVELGVGGFKLAMVAAALVVDLSHDLNTAIDSSIDMERDMCRRQIEKIYLAEQKLTKEDLGLEKDVDRYHANEIDKRTENYSSQLKTLFKGSEKYKKLVATLADTLRKQKNVRVNDMKADEQAEKLLDRSAILSKIEQLDPSKLNSEEKYKIMHYVRCHYSDSPVYMAAVRDKLYQRKKIGPLAKSIRHILYYVTCVSWIRALLALLMQTYFFITRCPTEAKAISHVWKDFARQLAADIGLVMKAIPKVIHSAFKTFGASVVIPLFILFSPLVALAVYPWRTEEHTPFSVVKNAYIGLSNFFFEPGYLTRIVDAIVGRLRQYAHSKHLHLATVEVRDQDERRALRDSSEPPFIVTSGSQKEQKASAQSLEGSCYLLARLLGTSVLSDEKSAKQPPKPKFTITDSDEDELEEEHEEDHDTYISTQQHSSHSAPSGGAYKYT